MKITVKTLGAKMTLEVTEGSSYETALGVFERIYNKSLEGMDLYENGTKVKDLTQTITDGAELTAVKSKHESAAIKVTFKTLGSKVTVECDDDSSCSDALRVFEVITSKSLEGMDLYKDGAKVKDLDATRLENGAELTAVKSKHESA